jgi:Restriction endonuclease
MKKGANGTTSTVSKGRILERIAALMHDQPNVTVKLNQRLPPIDGKGRQRREIDILLTCDVAGYPVRMAIECKNEDKPIGSPKIDAFVGKLEYVGIPPQHGIFISSTGYTTGAIERATGAGMRTLTLRGLTDENLLGSIAGAFQSIIYLLLRVESITVSNEVPPSKTGSIESFSFFNSGGKLAAFLPDLVWHEWLSGKISTTLGEHEIDIPLPANLYQMVNGKAVSTIGLSAKVRVIGLAVTLEGAVKEYVLVNAANKTMEKSLIDVSFDTAAQKLPVTTFLSEDQLKAFMTKPGAFQVTFGRINLPRIRYNNLFWPPSERVAQKLQERWLSSGADELLNLSPLELQEIEGIDLQTVWEPIWEGHPAGQMIREKK